MAAPSGVSASKQSTTDEMANGGLYSLAGKYGNLIIYAAAAVALIVTFVICLAIWGPGMAFPMEIGKQIGAKVDEWILWLTREGDWFFDGIKFVITKVLVAIEDFLLWLPWPVIIMAVTLLAWKVAGKSLGLFALIGLVLIGLMGRLPGGTSTLWEGSMETLALIIVAVGISLLIGLPMGVIGARNAIADSILRPILDGMQTMPSFVYLVPGILFFGLGNVPAVMATVIYAVAPVIRLTNLGIRQVSPEAVEAARSFGTTPLQMLTKVQIPMALPTIMAGINQTIMMALAMVVVASLVGAGGLGEAVLRALGRQEAGNSAIAGLAIVAIAVVIDRITQSVARERQRALIGD
jgi:glycine betaine/proline transport system permease protein